MIELVFKYYILQFIQTNLSSRSRHTPKSLRVNLKSLRRTPNNMFLLREIGLFWAHITQDLINVEQLNFMQL